MFILKTSKNFIDSENKEHEVNPIPYTITSNNEIEVHFTKQLIELWNQFKEFSYYDFESLMKLRSKYAEYFYFYLRPSLQKSSKENIVKKFIAAIVFK